jgi:hypothetical protein
MPLYHPNVKHFPMYYLPGISIENKPGLLGASCMTSSPHHLNLLVTIFGLNPKPCIKGWIGLGFIVLICQRITKHLVAQKLHMTMHHGKSTTIALDTIGNKASAPACRTMSMVSLYHILFKPV